MPGHTKCCTFRAKSSSQNWRSDAPKCNPSQEISVLTSKQLWWTCLLYYACHGKSIFADPLQMPHACHRFWKCCKTFTFCSLLARCTVPRACHTRAHYNFRNCSEKLCFVHFGFEMCFAPLWHARFRHLNFQKWSENGVFCTFWLQNVLCATTPCTFSIAELPKVVWDPHAFTLLTWKCASCHNGVHFFNIATPKSVPDEVILTFWLRNLRRATKVCNFSSLISRDGSAPAALASLLVDLTHSHKSLENTVFRDFSTFSRTCIFFLLTLSLLFSSLLFPSVLFSSLLFSSLLFSSLLWLFPPLLFHLSILSEVWLLNFLRQLYCFYKHDIW